MFKKNKGFTLIELMVVIAIISILATVVLVSLQSARDRAEDSNRISVITQIRSLAEVHRAGLTELSYTGLAADNEVAGLLTAYSAAADGGLVVEASGDNYCAQILLKNEKYFCTDDSLTASEIVGAYCTNSNISCIAAE